ncbi:MAG: CHAP domain-containing protein [Clostridia bacterium]|nr:CHAP domain-containing protein [Clostridia bacterium]
MKKLLACFMVLCLLMTMMPVSVAFADNDSFRNKDESDWDTEDYEAYWDSLFGAGAAQTQSSGANAAKTTTAKPAVQLDPDESKWDTDDYEAYWDALFGEGGVTLLPEGYVPGEATPGEAGSLYPDSATPGEALPDDFIIVKPEGEYDPAMAEGELKATLMSSVRYAFADRDEIGLRIGIAGGKGPYTFRMRITNENTDETLYDRTMTTWNPGYYTAAYEPDQFGTLNIRVDITDAAGEKSAAAVNIPVAVREYESRAKWEKSVAGTYFSGDWRQDIVEIAKTQIGYEESTRNFIIDELGRKMGYTRYGAWYGSDYGEWCAMFMAFCAEYANIPAAAFPRGALVQDVIRRAKGMDAYENASYVPQTGDLIFFDWEGDGTPDHAGIVEYANETDVTTIEGNSANAVRVRSYSHGSSEIIGYSNTTKLMVRAGLLDESALGEAEENQTSELPVKVEIQPGTTAYTLAAGVNLRQTPEAEGNRIAQIPLSGTVLDVLSMEVTGRNAWYQVAYEGTTGYIRGDLLKLEYPKDELKPAEISVQPQSVELAKDAESAQLVVEADHAAGYRWQRGERDVTGEYTWTDIAGANSASLVIPSAMENLRYAYRCVVTGEDKTETITNSAVLLRTDILEWLRADEEITDEMLRRALGAKSLEAMVIEDGELIYVRTGRVYATVDAETGDLVDLNSGLVIATVDMSSGKIKPKYDVKEGDAAEDDSADAEFAG